MAEAFTQEKKVKERPARKKLKFFAHYEPAELALMEQLYSSTLNEITEDEIIKGRIVSISNKDVTIDVGFKSEGIVSLLEFRAEDEVQVGDDVEVYLENIEDKMGQLILSKKKADVLRIWDKIYDSIENDTIINGKIINRVKGGMTVSLSGVEAFLPGSQIDVKPVRDFDALVGQTMDFRVVKINPVTQNIVVSHKVILEEAYAARREEMLANIKVGMVLEGTVKNITDFGIFVDLGGLDGLVHITDITWGRINHPSEVVDLDQPIKVVVVGFDENTKRVSLGMKQLESHPWENIEVKYPVTSKAQGRVVSITDYGAFVEIEKGIEGLVHISEMSWTQHIKHPGQFVTLGQEVECVILNIDKDHTKLSLSMKRVNEDPWIALSEKYIEGSLHKGTVSNITDFGVFVELEPGVDGLVHISDLSWTKKIRHPSELVKKNQDLEVKVLKFDVHARRIALGHKQINQDPWDEFEQKYAVGAETPGEISQIIEKGVIVILPGDVDGFVPVSHLLQGGVKDIHSSFKIGDALPLRVIEFDKENKRIILSALEYFKDKNKEEIEAYLAAHPNEKKEIEAATAELEPPVKSSEKKVSESVK
ncbi:30S ribosomal protein S1 [Pelodictyon phaeoclathratiforme]|jgi:small subunit ribosomal protein S1|uniref:30S ribosomal protein S1 n=1 Tax=Pelodictyon phaeoclathratiforme (strain DSM 5477 / BU-1) TaxID=324925 RepID=B4SCU4_PELPB|nr:30S ribosomal protein S1 [Pelodictyon phaeoclathratiforme]ACF42778.1 RNA binding S1 domain protein [Pelodictyon phaeoclathratiforme BU-1]MBV5289749.1 30S ribosomal protein S1 [Pelodictyon phaeoclathratiforme]